MTEATNKLPAFEGQAAPRKVTTKELIDELSKRTGVSVITVLPYEDKMMTFRGPVIVLEVID